MKALLTATFGLMLFSASAQTLNINLDGLAAKAKEKAEVTLDGPALAQALQAAPGKIKDSAPNLKSILIRHYEFEREGEFSETDLAPVRKQVSTWSRVISTKEEHESVDIYVLNQDGKPGAFLLIAAEPKELTIVSLVGSIDLASLKEVVDSTIHYDLKSVCGQ